MSGSRPTWTSGTVWGMIGLFSICSCANQGAPSGGPQDLTGPQVVETFPDTFAVVEAFDDEIRIGFDERISESGVQGPLDDAVIISPESGEVRVRHSSRAVTCDDGGRVPARPGLPRDGAALRAGPLSQRDGRRVRVHLLDRC